MSDKLTELQAALQTLHDDNQAVQHPARIQFISALLSRAEKQKPSVQDILLSKAETALANYPVANKETVSYTPKTDAIQALSALTLDLKPPAPVTDLTSKGLAFDEFLRQQEDTVVQSLTDINAQPEEPQDEQPGELRSARLFRQAQLKQFADSLVEQAIKDSPENPGPLNPQMLAIRALTNMRDLSPHYLNRFVTYIDTLFWLEQADDKSEAANKKADSKAKKSKAKA